jgi:hypothetical protein
MADTRDVAYIRKRLCNASDLMSEVFVRAEKMSKENIKLKELLKDCREFYQKMYSLNIINSSSLPLYDDLKKRINKVLGDN